MPISGLEGMSDEEVHADLQRGGRFVVYSYTISILIMTFRRSSDVIYVKSTDSRFVRGLPYTLLTVLAGWWGFPWGPIYSITSLAQNLGGGKDVTEQLTRR